MSAKKHKIFFILCPVAEHLDNKIIATIKAENKT